MPYRSEDDVIEKTSFYIGGRWVSPAVSRDWHIIADDLTLVTNNARDFRRLFAREPLHAGLVIIVPQVVPAR